MKVFHLDCIFISYDEPNAQKHFDDLVMKHPYVKRVHGVKGFDAAHKAAANLSNTDYFITVDADTIVDPLFFEQDIDLESAEQHCFSIRNSLSGLSSGNGSIKIWSKKAVLAAKTHEIAESTIDKLDFWQSFNCKYYVDRNFGMTYPDQTPLHAFRVGFRESIKAAFWLTRPDLFPDRESHMIQYCRNTIEVWGSVGLDSINGIYSMLGARVAAELIANEKISDISIINDYDKMSRYCNLVIGEFDSYQAISHELNDNKYRIAADKLDVNFKTLSAHECMFFKAVRTMNTPAIKKILYTHFDPQHEMYSTIYKIHGIEVISLAPHDCAVIYNLTNEAS